MSYPENTETVVIKNRFYPHGLSQLSIWKHYQLYKSRLLNEVRSRELIFAIMANVNKPIIKRKNRGKVIRLTNDNYNTIISGRTIAIYSTMRSYENFGIIDIDAPTFKQSKEIAQEIYNSDALNQLSRDVKIRYTGKTGFHLILEFQRLMRIDRIKDMIEYHLNIKFDKGEYTIGHKRQGSKPNLDISPNKIRGGFITPGSLSIIGLKCMDIKYRDLSLFTPYHAKVKEY